MARMQARIDNGPLGLTDRYSKEYGATNWQLVFPFLKLKEGVPETLK